MIDFGYKYDKRSSFLKTTEGASVSVPGPGMEGSGIKGKLGLGGSISENSWEVTLGLGVGAAVINNSDDVVQSISLSRSEANKVTNATDVWFETWNIDKDNIEQTEDGRYSTMVTTRNTEGKTINTGIRVYTDDLQSNMWYSEAYKKKSDSLDK